MEWIADPSIWAGLVTLVVIELVLGIDNLVFIAILAEKLPPSQRDRARVTGLLLAMVMRLLLLASISWLVTLTQPLFSIHGLSFSARDLIMLFGGLFLLFKATVELNERLEGKDSENPTQRRGAKFWRRGEAGRTRRRVGCLPGRSAGLAGTSWNARCWGNSNTALRRSCWTNSEPAKNCRRTRTTAGS